MVDEYGRKPPCATVAAGIPGHLIAERLKRKNRPVAAPAIDVDEPGDDVVPYLKGSNREVDFQGIGEHVKLDSRKLKLDLREDHTELPQVSASHPLTLPTPPPQPLNYHVNKSTQISHNNRRPSYDDVQEQSKRINEAPLAVAKSQSARASLRRPKNAVPRYDSDRRLQIPTFTSQPITVASSAPVSVTKSSPAEMGGKVHHRKHSSIGSDKNNNFSTQSYQMPNYSRNASSQSSNAPALGESYSSTQKIIRTQGSRKSGRKTQGGSSDNGGDGSTSYERRRYHSNEERGDSGKESPRSRRKKNIFTRIFSVTYKARNSNFHKYFSNVPDSERLLEDYTCALVKDILIQGRIYVSQNWICFHSNILSWETTLQIPISRVRSIRKASTIRVIPNAIVLELEDDDSEPGSSPVPEEPIRFTSFIDRNATFNVLNNLIMVAQNHSALEENGVLWGLVLKRYQKASELNGLLTEQGWQKPRRHRSADQQHNASDCEDPDCDGWSGDSRFECPDNDVSDHGSRFSSGDSSNVDLSRSLTESTKKSLVTKLPPPLPIPEVKNVCTVDISGVKCQEDYAVQVLDRVFPVSPDELYNHLIDEQSEFQKKFCKTVQKTLLSPGTFTDTSDGQCKTIRSKFRVFKIYVDIPLMSQMVTANENLTVREHVLEQENGTKVSLFEAQTVTTQPDVPYGTYFSVDIKVRIIPLTVPGQQGASHGYSSRVLTSVNINWIKRTFGKGLIEGPAKKGVHEYWCDQIAALNKFLSSSNETLAEEVSDTCITDAAKAIHLTAQSPQQVHESSNSHNTSKAHNPTDLNNNDTLDKVQSTIQLSKCTSSLGPSLSRNQLQPSMDHSTRAPLSQKQAGLLSSILSTVYDIAGQVSQASTFNLVMGTLVIFMIIMTTRLNNRVANLEESLQQIQLKLSHIFSDGTCVDKNTCGEHASAALFRHDPQANLNNDNYAAGGTTNTELASVKEDLEKLLAKLKINM